jgi:hypothetical protein
VCGSYVISLSSYSSAFDEVGDFMALFVLSFLVLGVLAVIGGLGGRRDRLRDPHGDVRGRVLAESGRIWTGLTLGSEK